MGEKKKEIKGIGGSSGEAVMLDDAEGDGAPKQTIDELTKRYSNLNTRKIQAETNLQNAERELKKLKEKARNEYGTDDLNQLRKQLADLEIENEQKRSTYQNTLDKIEADLTELDQKYTDVKDGKERKSGAGDYQEVGPADKSA